MCPGTRSRGKSFRFSVTITPVPPTTAAATTCSSSGSGSENVPSSGSQPVTIASPEVLAHRPDQPRTSRLGLRRKVLAPFELGGLMELWARRESPPPTTDDTNPRPPSTAGNPAAGSARGQSGQSIDHPPTLSAHAAGAPSLRDRFCAQLLRPHRRIVLVVDLHPRLRKRLVLAGRPLLLLLEHIPQQQPMPVANSRCRLPTFSAGNSPTSINRRTVGRLTPSRSAACCVVDIVARGATVTARPDPSAATTCLSAACTSAGNST